MNSKLYLPILCNIFIIIIVTGCNTAQPTTNFTLLAAKANTKGCKVTHLHIDHRPYAILKTPNKVGTKWLIDSGATQSILYEAKSNINNPDISIGSNSSKIIHGIFKSKPNTFDAFRYKMATAPQIKGYILSDSTRRQSKNRCDGVLGLNFLTENRAILYLPEKYLSWKSPPIISYDHNIIPLKSHPSTGHLLLLCYINNHPACFIIDSGASRSIIDMRAAIGMGLQLRATRSKLTGVNRSSSHVYRASNVIIQVHKSTKSIKAPLLVTDLSSLVRQVLDKSNEFPVVGILGYDLLSKYISIIDFSNQELHMP
jgi:hypothetical protein